MTRPRSFAEYLAGLDPAPRAALEKVRRAVLAAAPGANECISYGMPAFRLGEVIGGFAAHANHCSYYPFSGATLATLGDRLRDYDRTKSALRFPADRPLPASLVQRLVKARIAEIAAGRRQPAARRRDGPPKG